LLVQSLFCEHPDDEGFACQECESCRRIEREDSLDFFWAHPGGLQKGKPLKKKDLDSFWNGGEIQVSEKEKNSFRIKKDTILSLQDAFSKSAAGQGWQAYILEEYDKATPEASNSLLKFLEEPKEGLLGILVVNELTNVLPTIQSRTQILTFRPPGKKALKEDLASVIEDEESLEMLSSNGWDSQSAQEFLEAGFFEIREAAKKYWASKGSYRAVMDLQKDIFNSKSEYYSKKNVQLFLQWLLYLAKTDSDSREENTRIRMVILNALDQISRPVDLALLLDQVYSRIHQIVVSAKYPGMN
ncbi:MAG: hypothetical protein HUJ54_15480, partial [Erysipelotrichaceae bacterium]|nr:hypothetical protein [Erysipelotrichaceae bacterium]